MSLWDRLFTAQYYEHPEGEDYTGKMIATNRMTTSAALVVGVYDVVMYSHPKGYLPTLARFAYWLGPAVGMASAFTTGTYATARLRGKDDKLNYVIGSCAAAGVYGAWQRSAVTGFTMCLFFSLAGCVKKLSLEEGWNFFPEDPLPKKRYSLVDPFKYDLTLTEKGEKGYVTK